MEAKVSYLLILQKIYQLTAKDSGMKSYALCVGNISNDFITNNNKKTRSKGVLIFFC